MRWSPRQICPGETSVLGQVPAGNWEEPITSLGLALTELTVVCDDNDLPHFWW